MTLFKPAALAAALVAVIATLLPAAAHEGIQITDPYARVISGSGVVYFRIDNHGAAEDVLIRASSPVAGMVMLMNSTEDADGVMRMVAVPDGFAVKAGETRLLTNAADHVMLMEVTQKFKPGDTFPLTLQFLHAGEVTLTVPVDNLRRSDPTEGPTAYDATSSGGVSGPTDPAAP